ncbi:hypothetical protein scyTo_0012068, partial [Scyliorhinus torazame]|nr:hypothetical protein [Scyliorhinus torazame]
LNNHFNSSDHQVLNQRKVLTIEESSHGSCVKLGSLYSVIKVVNATQKESTEDLTGDNRIKTENAG